MEITKKGMDSMKNAAISVNEKIHDPNVQQGVKQLGSTVLNKSKDIGVSIKIYFCKKKIFEKNSFHIENLC